MKFFYVVFVFFSFYFLEASKVIEIDLSKQKLYAIENGRLLFVGNVSTGKEDYLTPRGRFRIIEKDRYHVSNKYPEPDGGAKMPYMLRLTNSGVAIHQGYLPGYPASHGCIRVTKRTAKKLWRWANIGTRVKIYGDTFDFIRYAKKKKRKYSKKRYAKKKSYKRKKYSKKRRYTKRRKRTSHSKRRHYVRTTTYRVIELYDDY